MIRFDINDDVKKLKKGDQVLFSGEIVTARDMAHKWLFEKKPKLSLIGIFHCGPIVKGKEVIAAGPTTSIREEPYMADIIKRYKLKVIIGKGGMGEKTQKACKKYGCVYLSAIGGCAQLIADCVKVKGVSKLEFGPTEAMWKLEVKDLPAVVLIDG